MAEIEQIKVGDTLYDIRDAGAERHIEGKVLSDNNYTAGEKSKLAGIEAGAQVNPTIDAQPVANSNNPVSSGGVAAAIAGFVTTSVNDLANYYLKTETYTKAEVQALIDAVKQFTYEVANVLPTASAATMHKIYLVPSADPQQQNIKDEFITLDNGVEAQTRYTWEQIGSTAIDLSGYVTTIALNTALANYTPTTELTALLAAKQTTIDNNNKLPYSLLSGTPSIPEALADLSDDVTHRLVTDTEKAAWNGKAEIYYADYGNTPFKAVQAAYQAGKLIIANWAGMKCQLSQAVVDVFYRFIYIDADEGSVSAVTVTPGEPPQRPVWAETNIHKLGNNEIDTIWNNTMNE